MFKTPPFHLPKIVYKLKFPPIKFIKLPPFLTNIEAKLITLGLLFGLLPLLVFGSLVYSNSRTELEESTFQRINQVADLQAQAIDQWFSERQANIIALSLLDAVETMDPAKFTTTVQQFYNQWKTFENISVIAPDGATIFRTDGTTLNLADRDYFKQALGGETVISDPIISLDSGNVIIVIAAPIYNNGNVVGVVSGSISSDKISFLLKIAQQGQTGEAYLINGKSYFTTSPRYPEKLITAGLIKQHAEMEMQVRTFGGLHSLSGVPGASEYQNYRNIPVIGAYRFITSTGWGLLVEQEKSEAFASVDEIQRLILITTLISVLAIVFLTFYFSRLMAAPIKNMSKIADQIAGSDLHQLSENAALMATGNLTGSSVISTQIFKYRSNDELGDLSQSINKMITHLHETGHAFSQMNNNLRMLVEKVIYFANNLGTASESLVVSTKEADSSIQIISTGLEQMSEGINKQTGLTESTVSSVDQLSSAIKNVARGALEQSNSVDQAAFAMKSADNLIQTVVIKSKDAANAANLSANMAKTGTQTIGHIQERILAIKTKAQIAGETVSLMDKHAKQIGVIVETIGEIASQTNLLALNAAIEAARAGEHGKGFAVVADEVRKLAEKSSAAAKEISRLIRDTQNSAKEAGKAVDDSLLEVEASVNETHQSGQSLNQIFETIEAVGKKTVETNLGTQELQQALSSLSNTLGMVSAIVDENTTAAEQMAASSNEMNHSIAAIKQIGTQNAATLQQVVNNMENVIYQMDAVGEDALQLAEMEKGLLATVKLFTL